MAASGIGVAVSTNGAVEVDAVEGGVVEVAIALGVAADSRFKVVRIESGYELSLNLLAGRTIVRNALLVFP